MKYLLILLVGGAVGYTYGFKDAQVHKHPIVTRIVSRVGGSNRDKYNEDIDKRMEAAEKR
jgi:hypothetical protein